VQELPAPYLHDDEYIEDAKAGSDCDDEIAGQDGVCMIPNKSLPALGSLRGPP
jgi:hypothetical protein